MATRLTSATFGYQNFYSATLTSDITSGTTVIGVSTVPTPTAGILVFEPDSTTNREVVLYTSKGASTITAPSDGRGYSGSTAAAHLQGTAVIMAPVDKWFTALASGELSSDPLRTELFFDYVASGLVWTADAAGASLNASMTSGVIYILGKRLTLAAVTARPFTLNKDTYIDVSDNGDGTGLITYNEATTNAASPALTTNNIRIGIIQAAATITAATKVNQGQEDRVFPIASSIAYSVTDSLGNLICPRDPIRKLLGYSQRVSNSAGITTVADVGGVTVNVIVPTLRKCRISFGGSLVNTVANTATQLTVYESGASIALRTLQHGSAGASSNVHWEFNTTLTAGLHTYTLRAIAPLGGTSTVNGSASDPSYLRVDLI